MCHARRGLSICGLCTAVLLFNAWLYARNSTRRWFTEDLPDVDTVKGWTPEQLDRSLRELSRWDGFSNGQFQSFVAHQVKGLGGVVNRSLTFLEVGVGVGAFARHFLSLYPNATGLGIDLEPQAIAIAEAVLPKERIALAVADMRSIPAPSASFDYVVVPGALCYLHSIYEVQTALAEFARVLRPHGALCASMLADATSNMGSCNVRIPRSLWRSRGFLPRPFWDRGMEAHAEAMDRWGLPHSLGRYSVCLRPKSS